MPELDWKNLRNHQNVKINRSLSYFWSVLTRWQWTRWPQMVRSSHGKNFLRPFGTYIRYEWDFFIQILKNFEISNDILWKSDMVITIESYVIEKRDGNVSFNDRDFRRIPLYSVLFHFIRKNRIFKFFEIRKIKLTLKLKRQNHKADASMESHRDAVGVLL